MIFYGICFSTLHWKLTFLLQVRLGLVQEDGRVNTTMLGKHRGSVYKLAVEPGSPHIFYSCGEDGFVQHVSLVL